MADGETLFRGHNKNNVSTPKHLPNTTRQHTEPLQRPTALYHRNARSNCRQAGWCSTNSQQSLCDYCSADWPPTRVTCGRPSFFFEHRSQQQASTPAPPNSTNEQHRRAPPPSLPPSLPPQLPVPLSMSLFVSPAPDDSLHMSLSAIAAAFVFVPLYACPRPPPQLLLWVNT